MQLFFDVELGLGGDGVLFFVDEEDCERDGKRDELGRRSCKPKPRHVPKICKYKRKGDDCDYAAHKGDDLRIQALVGRCKIAREEQVEARKQHGYEI